MTTTGSCPVAILAQTILAQVQAGFRNVLFLLLFGSPNGMTAPSLLSQAVAWGAWAAATGSGACGTRVHRRGPGLLFRWFCAAVTRLGLALAWPRVGDPFAPCACCVGPHPPPPRGGHARACTAGAFAAHRGRSTSERGSRSVALRGLGGEGELRALAAGAGLSPAALAAALAAPGLEAGGAGSTPAALPGAQQLRRRLNPRRFRGHDDARVPLRAPYKFQPARGETRMSFHVLPHMFVA